MKQVININFHGQVVPIEVSAFDLLKSYTDSLARYFANEEGKEEIINDIESRIGELFQERLKKGATCITDEDVNAIIKSMGRPEEFEGEEEKAATSLGAKADENKSSDNSQNAGATGAPKRLYRDENNKVLGGVCGGIANYFGTDPMIIRIAFILISLAFGTGILAYIIMWIAVPSTASAEIGGIRKKLYRNPDDKIVAGVCSGIGNYFGISPWIPRVFFLLPFLSFVFRMGNWGYPHDFFNFSFSPGSLIVYIILWLVFPEAGTTAEKLEMKGEKVDMNSIKNSVVNEMKGVQQRAEKFGQEAKEFAEEKGKVMGAEIKTAAKRGGTSLGDVIIFFAKVVAYFIIGSVSFALVCALFALAIVSIGLFPLKDFLLNDNWQNWLAWGTLVFFIALPVIGVITWIIRRLAKMKSNRKVLRFTFISLWVVGWVCAVCLLASVSKDFRTTNNMYEQEVALSNPSVNKLEVTTRSAQSKFSRYNWLKFEPFSGVDEDTAYIKNIDVKIVKSTNDSFRVTMVRFANGRYKKYADTTASLIQFSALQNDSILLLDKGIAINKKDKFRNQRVMITVYVPVGKQIRVDKSVGYGFNFHINDNWDEGGFNIDTNDEERGWEENVDYVMKADGLYTLDGTPADEWKHENNKKNKNKVKIGPDGIEVNGDNGEKITIDKNGVNMNEGGDNYRYDNNQPLKKLDSIKMKFNEEEKRLKDSLKKEIEKTQKQLEKIGTTSNDKEEAPEVLSSYHPGTSIPMLNIY